MKKTYSKPEMAMMNMDVEKMISASDSFNPLEAGNEDVVGVRGRRGSWGDLWNDDEDAMTRF